jgi:hypothetical protein
LSWGEPTIAANHHLDEGVESEWGTKDGDARVSAEAALYVTFPRSFFKKNHIEPSRQSGKMKQHQRVRDGEMKFVVFCSDKKVQLDTL